MFTGIIEETGIVKKIALQAGFGTIHIAAKEVLSGTRKGDSICVNGVCLTVTAISAHGFTADVMAETLRRSALGALRVDDPVNLERAMPADGRFGGHIVSGHIDGVGIITQRQKEGNAVIVHIEAEPQILNLIVEKGSIAIDGISLTVASVNTAEFTVSIIPLTAEHTSLLHKQCGETVNLENDVIGKYIQKCMQTGIIAAKQKTAPSTITEAFLKTNGF